MQEIESTNVGIRRIPRPFTYNINDTPDREFSRIDNYDENTVKQLSRISEDMVDDAAVDQDAD